MRLNLPRQKWSIWLLAVSLPVCLSLTAFVYYDALLASGTLDPNADSISIPIFSTIMFAVVASPVIAAITAVCLRNYPGSVSLMNWYSNRPRRSVILSIVFGIPAIITALGVVHDLSKTLPWYEYLWLPISLLLIAWLLVLRAAVVGQGNPSSEPVGRVFE
jgi:hypothetical protein